MMKKTHLGVILLIFCMIFTLSVPFFAAEDIDIPEDPSVTDTDVNEEPEDPEASTEPEENTEEPSDPEVENAPVSVGNDCLCGREYYTENVGEHSKYDCIKCGKNMYACTCNCWCGAATVLDTSGAYGGVSPRLCSGCNKPCPECDCRDNKEEVLAAEKLRLNGEVSPLNLPRPENGWNLFFALFTVLLLASAAVYLPHAPFITKKSSVSEENIDISEVFAVNSDAETDKKPEKAYETPEEERSDVKKNVVKPVQTKNAGNSVYEKINLPWMTSANNIISINEAAAKIIVNESEVISGDMITVSELSEDLMENKPSSEKKVARFPEFFGAVEEGSESEGEKE